MRSAQTLADCTGCCGQLGFISGPVDNGEGARKWRKMEENNVEMEKAFKKDQPALLVLLFGNDII